MVLLLRCKFILFFFKSYNINVIIHIWHDVLRWHDTTNLMLQVTAQTEKQPGVCSAHPRLNIVYTFLLKITYSLEAKFYSRMLLVARNPHILNGEYQLLILCHTHVA